jgi:ferredoxin
MNLSDHPKMNLSDHPTVRRYAATHPAGAPEAAPRAPLDREELRRLALAAGADDAGVVELGRAELAGQKEAILAILPGAKSVVAFVLRMRREAIRAPARSLANVEFHMTGEEVNDVGRHLVDELERRGVRAVNATMGFPMEADRWPRQMHVVSQKPVAVAAGLGHMGIHRNVIHPRFGSFVLLGSVVLDAEVAAPSRPLDYNPCLECRLCVAACPTGAIAPDGSFNFSACYTHNYREFMSGFGDWVEQVVESKDRLDYRRRVSDAETVSVWQSLGFGPNYKAAYCLAVCPAGEEVIGPFLSTREEFLRTVVKPLQSKAETVFVVAGSDAEEHVAKRFPSKRTKRVHNGLRPDSIEGFLFGMKLNFQPKAAAGLDATYHFTFKDPGKNPGKNGGKNPGKDPASAPIEATVVIRGGHLTVARGHEGKADFKLAADAAAWIRFVRREGGLLWPLLRGAIRFRGDPRLLLAFGRCFPV